VEKKKTARDVESMKSTLFFCEEGIHYDATWRLEPRGKRREDGLSNRGYGFREWFRGKEG
jgi:hypothetical protein